MAPDFVVEGTHLLALQVQVEVDVELAITPGIAPDRRRWRLRAAARVTQKVHHMRLVKPDQPVETACLRRWRRRRLGYRLERTLFRTRHALAGSSRRQIRQHRRAGRRLL